MRDHPDAVTPLTGKQQRFVEEYLVDLNVSAAAKRAGYSQKTAHQIGHDLMKKPKVKNAIDAAMAARSRRTRVTADDVVLFWAKVMTSKPHYRQVVIDSNGKRKTVKKELTVQHQIDASRMLGQHFGILNNKPSEDDATDTARQIREALLEMRQVNGLDDAA
jgi:hypothetical protein